MTIKVIKKQNEINFINPIKTSLFELPKCSKLCGKHILCEYIDVMEGTIILYAYSNSSKRINEHINKNSTKHKYYTAKVPKESNKNCLEGVY